MKNNSNLYLILFICTVFIMSSCSENFSIKKETDSFLAIPQVDNLKMASVNNAKNKTKNNQSNEGEPFPYLKRLKIGNITVGYSESKVTLINKKVTELDKNHPFYCEEGPCGEVVLFKTKISSSSSIEYLVVYSPGPSADPAFTFYDVNNVKYGSELFSISGLSLYIPENGNIYVDGHTNNMFNKRRKFKVNNGTFTETKQPYYYVGLKTQSAKALKLYDAEKGGNVIANIPANYNIEVLLAPFSPNAWVESCLIKTEFGLTGWVHLSENQMHGNEDIKGFYFAGD